MIGVYLDSLTLDTADPKAKRMLLKLHEIDYGPYFNNDIAIKALYWDDPDMPEGKLFKQYIATI